MTIFVPVKLNKEYPEELLKAAAHTVQEGVLPQVIPAACSHQAVQLHTIKCILLTALCFHKGAMKDLYVSMQMSVNNPSVHKM